MIKQLPSNTRFPDFELACITPAIHAFRMIVLAGEDQFRVIQPEIHSGFLQEPCIRIPYTYRTSGSRTGSFPAFRISNKKLFH